MQTTTLIAMHLTRARTRARGRTDLPFRHQGNKAAPQPTGKGYGLVHIKVWIMYMLILLGDVAVENVPAINVYYVTQSGRGRFS